MLEQIFRQMFGNLRPNVVEVIARLEKRCGRNEKMEFFLMKKAEHFPKDPRGVIRFVFYFGIIFGWLLSGNRNQEIEDLFEVRDISDETKIKLEKPN